MKKRILSLLLSIVMVIGILPITALAANEEAGVHVEEQMSQDPRQVMNDTLAQLAKDVPNPKFGTKDGEWTVLALARGGYFDSLSNEYFKGYYDRIVETVNETAAKVNNGGALHKSKLTENSRLILALSAIGKESTQVGDWNIVEPLSNIKNVSKQGINGPIYALLALDTYDYQTSNPNIRQECVDYILKNQLKDGGWALFGTNGDPDITSMALQALGNYESQDKVKKAIENGVNCLSAMQTEDGGYGSWGTVNSESCAQAIVACTALGINPHTDPRFVKNGNSVVDALLSFYVENEKGFAHTAGDKKNAMATDQAAYALVSYTRLLDGKTALYDMSDVKPAEVDPNVTSYWPNFRGNANNMAIVNSKTPTEAAHTELKWAKKLGAGWSAAPSVQIIVDDSLIVMSGQTLHKLNLETGEIEATAKMSAAPNWGYTPPTYGEGLIFCPLSGGVIEAFNAKTLDLVWTYRSPESGANSWQALSPITYTDGCVYTGFWASETKAADFICLNAKTGKQEWKYSVNGGFYWAGSVAIGDYIAVGTDDGANGSAGDSRLLVFKKTYGSDEPVAPVSEEVLTGCGDQRSSLAYADGKVYFTTKGGYLGSVAIDSQTGVISDLKTASFGKESTSTPIVYGNYVYFGTGKGFGNGWFTIAEKDTLKVVNEIQMLGYPQCSLLLSTAYEKKNGNLYFYGTYNGNPGGISMITVKPDEPTSAVLTEIYNAQGYEQYCICSPICDENGTIYYKNDSGNVLAVGKKMVPGETKHDVTFAITPKNAKVAVTAEDGQVVTSNLDGTYSLINGVYHYTVSADGYQNKTGTFTVSNNAQTITVVLVKDGGGSSGGGSEDKIKVSFRLIGATKSSEDVTFTVSNNAQTITVVLVKDGGGSSGGGSEDKIKVSFRLIGATKSSEDVDVGNGKGDSKYQNWIKTKSYKLDQGSTVYDLFTEALNNAGLQYLGAEDNYVSTIYAPEVYGGYALSEFTNGPRSGWMYTLNGSHPDLGLKDQKLKSGDSVVWHYVNDYAYEVKDWFDDPNYPAQGDSSTWVDWDNDIPDTSPSSQGGGTGGNVGGSVQTETSDQKAADKVIKLISEIGSVTKNSGSKIAAARKAYDALTDVQKKLVSNYKKLTAAEAAFAKLNGNLLFTDVKAGDYYFDAVKWAVEKQITSGTTATTFSPNLECSRAQMVTFLWRTAGSPEPKTTKNPFVDVNSDAWYYKAVLWAVENNVTNGTSDVTFSPNMTCTRAQMVMLLWNQQKRPAGVSISNTFTDVAADAYYAKAVAWAAEQGIVKGTGEGRFSPNAICTRGEIVTVLFRNTTK